MTTVYEHAAKRLYFTRARTYFYKSLQSNLIYNSQPQNKLNLSNVRFITGEGRMRNKTVYKMILSFLFISVLSIPFIINPVHAYTAPGIITIKSDGTVDPSTAPVTRTGSLYTITQNISTSFAYGIEILKSNIILDGAGFAIHHTTTGKSGGIYVLFQTNITIERLSVDSFDSGIYLYYSSFNNISGDTLTSNYGGLRLDSANYNSITCSNITSNFFGIYCYDSMSNQIYHNNLVDNTFNAYVTWDLSYQQGNTWDNDYPSGGNYWSNYHGIDSNGDGIGDTPLIIDANNRDNYPLMYPCGTYHFTIETNFPQGGTTNPPTGTHSYETATQVEVTAIPNPGFIFAYWKLGPQTINDNPTTVLVNCDKSIQAFFTPKQAVPAVPFGVVSALFAMIITFVGFAKFKRTKLTKNSPSQIINSACESKFTSK